jgi:hypothetical protein
MAAGSEKQLITAAAVLRSVALYRPYFFCFCTLVQRTPHQQHLTFLSRFSMESTAYISGLLISPSLVGSFVLIRQVDIFLLD